MALAHLVLSPWTALALLVAVYLYPFLVTHKAIRHIPGPPLARISNLWLLMTARKGKRYELVDEAHKRYGPVMRIQPNHVSVNDDSAINVIYGHGNGFLKAYAPPRPHFPSPCL